jgi:alginate O-acetyltransferase complex protein AlgI
VTALLFNSFSFLFLYLPIVLAGYFLLGRVDPRWAVRWLAAASLFFYGYWSLRYLPLLLASIAFNYVAAQAILAAGAPRRKRLLVAALAVNLLLLGYFKYAKLFIGLEVVLPVGISFFTFTQIAFLVDCYRREVRAIDASDYLLFVSYFPHLIAGPVLHHKEMMPQFADRANALPSSANFALGLSIFVVGLAKKVLLADNIAPLAAPVFAAGAHPPLIEAWIGVFAYTVQLYFDFSGYSDMAIGLSRLFGVRLPLNFNSPYQAADISDFWRRWHMTLSRFLRDYLYITLGGSHAGPARRTLNLMVTMLLGGLWHGAGWTFLAWGGLHGLYLVIHHGWRACGGRLPRWAGRALTLLAVMLGWVFFRADSFSGAFDVFAGLAGQNGVALPHGLAPLAPWLPGAPSFTGLRWIEAGGLGLPALALGWLLALAAPTTNDIFFHYKPSLDRILQARPVLSWRPRPGWGLACAALFIGCVFGMNRVSEFLYFQF